MAASRVAMQKMDPLQRKASKPRVRRARTGPVSEEEAQERAARVMRSAGEEFLRYGYDGANIDRIAKKSLVGKSTIYADFGDKKGLYRAFYIDVLKNFRIDFEAAISKKQEFRDTIREIVHATVYAFDDTNVRLIRMAIAGLERFPYMSELIALQAESFIKPFGVYLRREAGVEMSIHEARRRAVHLLHMALGGIGSVLSDAETYFGDREQWIESVTDTFISGFPSKRARKLRKEA